MAKCSVVGDQKVCKK